MVGLSRLRFAAGVCVLAAGLLMGAGGAVAVADPGSSGSAAHGDDGTNASGQQIPPDAKKPKDEPGGTDTKDGSLGSGGQSGQQHSTGAKKPKDEPGGTDTKDGTKDDSDLGAAVPDPVAAVPNEVAPVSEAVAPVADPVAAVPNEVAPVSDASCRRSGSGHADLGCRCGRPAHATAVRPLFLLVGHRRGAPVSDVSALVQDMLTSVAGAVVLLAQLPSDLFSFLLGIAGVQPVVGGVAGIHGPGLSAAAGASVASRLPLGLPLAGISGPPLAGVSGLPVTGEATGVAPLDVIALGRASAVSGMAPLAPDAAFPIGAGSSFRHVFGEILLPVSLWALAAGALPGAGGLVILYPGRGARGIPPGQSRCRITHNGHRALRPSGAVPLGVVRSGSLVVIRPRALRVVRPGALSAEHLLDKVA